MDKEYLNILKRVVSYADTILDEYCDFTDRHIEDDEDVAMLDEAIKDAKEYINKHE